MDADNNVDEAESWSTRPEREKQAYEGVRTKMECSTGRRSQRRAEIGRGKRAMTERYKLVDEDLEGEYVPEQSGRATKLLHKPDELTVEEYIKLFKLNDFWGTRFLSSQTLAQLGLLEDIQHLF